MAEHDELHDLMGRPVGRRSFLRLAAAAGLAATGSALAACGAPQTPAAPTAAPATPAAKATTAASASPAAGSASPAAAASPAAKAAAQKVKVGHLVKNIGNLIELYPQVGPKYGIDYEVLTFPDSNAMLQALLTGGISLTAITKQHLMTAIDQKFEVAMVGGYDGGNTVILVHKDVAVAQDDWKGLKTVVDQRKSQGNKFKIGVPTNSMQHAMIAWQLKNNGIDPENDLEVLNVAFPDHAKVLELKQVDMVSAVATFAAAAVMGGNAKLFNHATKTPAGFFDVGFVVTRKLMKEQPDLVQGLVFSHAEAMKMIEAAPDKGLANEVKYTELPQPLLAQAYQWLAFDHRVDVSAIKGMAKIMADLGWTKTDLGSQVDNYVDLGLLAKATGQSVADLSKW